MIPAFARALVGGGRAPDAGSIRRGRNRRRFGAPRNQRIFGNRADKERRAQLTYAIEVDTLPGGERVRAALFGCSVRAYAFDGRGTSHEYRLRRPAMIHLGDELLCCRTLGGHYDHWRPDRALVAGGAGSAGDGAKAECANNLKQIALGFLQHEERQKILPSGGWTHLMIGDPDRGFGRRQPGCWDYSILPFVEQQALHDLGHGLREPAKATAIVQRITTPAGAVQLSEPPAAPALPRRPLVQLGQRQLGHRREPLPLRFGRARPATFATRSPMWPAGTMAPTPAIPTWCRAG